MSEVVQDPGAGHSKMESFVELIESAGSFLSNNIGPLTGVIAAIAALWAARAASRSAKHAQDVERRGQRRDVVGAAQSIIAQARRVEDLGTKLTLAYQTLFTFSGGSRSSRLNLYVDEIAKLMREVAPLREKAESQIAAQKALRELSQEDLAGLMAELSGDLIHVRTVKEEFEHDLGEIESQNVMYREQVIKKVK